MSCPGFNKRKVEPSRPSPELVEKINARPRKKDPVAVDIPAECIMCEFFYDCVMEGRIR